ncbi:hypothetical protein PVAP13_3NG040480 [Panicum virgatum]|uniref:Uncharacterized protein n=1 Tax=Panicum virgatum TaxID=38727 RepID=A0A8T0U5Z8_PANVG|nr:hypothetical protein PVAP13_3NG040480 [Panicum virgatum]
MFVMIKELLADNMVDFVGLQETIKKKYSNAFLRKIDPHKKYMWHWIPSDGKSGGILCGVNLEKFDVTNFSVGTFSLSVNVMCKKEKKKSSCWSQSMALLMMKIKRTSSLRFLSYVPGEIAP